MRRITPAPLSASTPPIASVAIGHGEATVKYPDGSQEVHAVSKTFSSAQAIHALIDRIEVSGEQAKVCGLYGYTSFNAVRYFENIAVKDETQTKNDAPKTMHPTCSIFFIRR